MGLKHSHQFIENPKHFFECFYPPTPEEFIWKQHPSYELLWANNAGYLEWRDPDWDIAKGNLTQRRGSYSTTLVRSSEISGAKNYRWGQGRLPKVRFASWGRLVFEAFNGHAPKGKRILRINHNIYDDRPTNFAFYVDYPLAVQWLKEEKAFITATHREMWKREQKLKIDIEPLEYFTDVLMVPHDYTEGYEKFKKLNGYIRHGNNC